MTELKEAANNLKKPQAKTRRSAVSGALNSWEGQNEKRKNEKTNKTIFMF